MNKKTKDKNTIIVSELINCARCGEKHYNLTFSCFVYKVDDYTHWASCPKNGQPILLKQTYGK